MDSGCGECEVEALSRVLATRDLLDLVLWAETHPLRGIEGAISALQNARNMYRAAGFELET